MFVHDVMTHEITTVGLDTTVKHAIEVLAEHKISMLPVLDSERRLAGVVSEVDLLRDSFPRDPRLHLMPLDGDDSRLPRHFVSEVMSEDVISAHEGTDVADVVELMTSTGFKCLPVVDGTGNLVGVVSRSDLVRLRARPDHDIQDSVDSAFDSIGHAEWQVSVSDGVVEIKGPDSEQDRSLARASASIVPGVAAVTVR